MEQIRIILGLVERNGRITDKFTIAFINCLERLAGKLFNSGGLCVQEEVGPLGNRKEILDGEEDEVYGKALRLLAKLRPEYKKYLPGRKKAPGFMSKLLKKKMRLAVWTGTGKEIPFRELNAVFLKNFLTAKGYAYRRKKGEMGWYRRSLFVGKNLFDVLEHLESIEEVDRSRLTISF